MCVTNTHDEEEDKDPRQSLIVSTGKTKQSHKHNHNIDKTRPKRPANTGTYLHRSTKVINKEVLNRITKSNQSPW